MAYVYGHFRMDGVSAIHAATNNYASLGLRFVCSNGQSFTIGLSPSGDQVLEVPAGECSLKTVSFNNGMSGNAMDVRPYPGPALQNFTLRPGRLHYLGDMVGSYTEGGAQGGINWKLSAIANRFGEASARVAASHNRIGQLPKVDATGVPVMASNTTR
jgi:hypothetical protein